MLQIAKVLKSNGVDGDVLIGTRGFSLEDFDTEEPVFIEFDGLPVPFFIESMRAKGTDKAIVHLTDVSSLEDAEEIVGRAILADWETEEEEGADFIGWTVFDKGRRVGEVTGIEPIPGNLCLYLGGDLIPLHEDFILDMDAEHRELHLDLPEGLFS